MGKTRPWYSPRRLVQRALIYGAVIYAALGALLYLGQNGIEYPRVASGAALPPDRALREARQVGLVPWDGATSGAAAPEGYVPIHFAEKAARGTFVVFHGNGSWAGRATAYVDALSRRGFRVFLYEYPGYGGRSGTPSEKTIVPEARALVRSLDAQGYGPIYLWGESLGAGVAAAVCADPGLPVHGLALSTPWDTIAEVGLYRYPFMPIRGLMTDRYDSIANLEHFRHPICVVRGSLDTTIPPTLTIHLFAHLREPKKLMVKEGYGHGDWPSEAELPWWDEVLDFVAGKSGGA